MSLEAVLTTFASNLVQELKAELKAEVKAEVLAELTGDIGPGQQEDWVGIDELQQITGWGRTTLENWRNQGKFMSMRKTPNGKVLYNLPDVQRFLRQQGKQKAPRTAIRKGA